MKTVSKARFHTWWILVVIGALLAAALLSGCEAARPFVHVDRNGYRAGVEGTWRGVAKAVKAEDFKEVKP